MDIALKVLYFVLIAAGGWLYFYLGVRQLVFGLTVGYPLIKSFGGTGAFAGREARKLNHGVRHFLGGHLPRLYGDSCALCRALPHRRLRPRAPSPGL